MKRWNETRSGNAASVVEALGMAEKRAKEMISEREAREKDVCAEKTALSEALNATGAEYEAGYAKGWADALQAAESRIRARADEAREERFRERRVGGARRRRWRRMMRAKRSRTYRSMVPRPSRRA